MKIEHMTKEEMFKDVKQLLKWLLSTDLHGISLGKVNDLDAKYHEDKD